MYATKKVPLLHIDILIYIFFLIMPSTAFLSENLSKKEC